VNTQTRKKKKADPQPKQEPRLKPVSFMAAPEEIERWRVTAKKADRKLSWWIRRRLLDMEEREQDNLVRTVEHVEGVSAS